MKYLILSESHIYDSKISDYTDVINFDDAYHFEKQIQKLNKNSVDGIWVDPQIGNVQFLDQVILNIVRVLKSGGVAEFVLDHYLNEDAYKDRKRKWFFGPDSISSLLTELDSDSCNSITFSRSKFFLLGSKSIKGHLKMLLFRLLMIFSLQGKFLNTRIFRLISGVKISFKISKL